MLDTPTFKDQVIPNADAPDQPIMNFNFGLRSTADVEIIFRDITERLCEQIDQADCVFGCVAWLTSDPILKSLAKKKEVGIIVQKEDFLRPDSGGKWAKQKLRDAYQAIPGFHRMSVGVLRTYCYADGNPDAAIRCAGFHNSKGSSAFPRMHNKFLVFCKRHWFRYEYDRHANVSTKTECTEPSPLDRHFNDFDSEPIPYAAWTGSFNPTYNASNSLENAILIRDAAIADAFMQEFGVIFGLSERLNWTRAWVAPQYRIGT